MTRSPRLELISPPELSDRAPYAYASVASNVERLVFTAGACPIDADGATVEVGGVRGQADKAMDNLEAALKAAGAAIGDVAKLSVYVATDRQEDLLAAWDVVHARFGDHEPPSTLLGVSVLGYRDQLVEVEAVAVL